MPDTMRAAVLVEPGRVEIHDAPKPEPGPDQVRVKLRGCGVCASNVPPFEGRDWFNYPMEPGALGHEGWGVVDAVGEGVSGLREGDAVVTLTQQSYAQYVVADSGSVVRLPTSLRDRPLPGEPLGCAVNILRRAKAEPTQTVAIIGIGFLGAVLTRLAKLAGARVIALSRRTYSLDIATKMGADETVQLDDDRWETIRRVAELTNGVGGYGDVTGWCPRVIECTGKQAGLDLVGEIAAVRGRVTIAGFHQDGPRQVDMQLWNWRGLDIINAHERDPKLYVEGTREAVKLIASGRLDPNPLYTHTFPLDRLADALAMTRDRPDGFVKAIIEM